MTGFWKKWSACLFTVVVGLAGCSEEAGQSSESGSAGEPVVNEPSSSSRVEQVGEEVEEPSTEPCVPSCDGIQCGQSDGCGASCGCDSEESECVDGVCCTPDCSNRECGGDGCGGSCGTCEVGSCSDGQCCIPDCSEKECGDNGCGGVCGFCNDPSNPVCTDGACGPACVPDCIGKECGFDGCGGSCGLCLETGKPICNDGICGADESCGPDGCLLTGTVFSPAGNIPIAGAEVFLSLSEPSQLNEKLHCDKCFQFSEDTPVTITNSSGNFLLPVPSAGAYFLGVQKGGFRRVRPLQVMGGEQAIPQSQTTLPGISNPDEGDSVPNMAVVGGGYDEIETTLTNLGISHDFYEADTQGVGLISDWDTLSQYQVLFLPCAGGWLDNYLSDQGTLDTLRNFVSAGGRLYVTDWSYDILVNAFPDPLTFVGDTGTLGSAQGSVYDADAWVEDIGLESWLNAQGIVDFVLEANWTEIESVNVYEAPNELNIIQVFLPKVWVRGESQDSSSGGFFAPFEEVDAGSDSDGEDASDSNEEDASDSSDTGDEVEEESGPPEGFSPATVSFQYGCGRTLFSTYHTENGGGGTGLLPQEKALLYTVLEVVLCIGAKF